MSAFRVKQGESVLVFPLSLNAIFLPLIIPTKWKQLGQICVGRCKSCGSVEIEK